MQYKSLALVAALALGCALNASADDKNAKPVKAEVKKTEVKVEKRDEGSGFKHFWIHTVGGSIGNGLKSGAHKISSAF